MSELSIGIIAIASISIAVILAKALVERAIWLNAAVGTPIVCDVRKERFAAALGAIASLNIEGRFKTPDDWVEAKAMIYTLATEKDAIILIAREALEGEK